ncbi:MAG: hypothetical protein KGL11_13480 [Alphaproteobacteria bacterium]|nr:hypothetical protein [Alphaproteobacteria bacterium]
MRRLWLLAFVLLAACNGPPTPIMGRTAPPAALSPPDSAGIYVLPAENTPAPSAAALAAAMATALQQADVPASASASNRGSYRLRPVATVEPAVRGQTTVSIVWQLRDAAGRLVGSAPSRTDADAEAWRRGDSTLAAALAALAAPVIAKLIEGDVPAPKGGLNPVVALRPVTGAPGDGDRSLTRAMGEALKRVNLTLAAGAAGKADFIVAGTVEVAPVDGQKQQVKITWALLRPDGGEVGRVNQENAVPAGSLDGAWGEVAYAVTNAAAPGVRRLIEEVGLTAAGGS